MSSRRFERNGAATVGVGAALLLTASGLAGCGGGGDTGGTPPPTPPSAAPSSAPARSATPATAAAPQPAKAPSKPAPPAGLTALATPQQVVDAIEVGRPDPFAPSQPPAGSTTQIGPDGKPLPPRPTLPAGFKLTGMIRTGGRAQAFVQIGDRSGPLCPGPRGRCSGADDDQPLLPVGWSVTGIDAANGLLAVTFGRQRQVIRLDPDR